jgi:aldose 1-epimerase
VCAQNFPNAVNQPTFPNVVLQPGVTYKQQLVYRFYAKPTAASLQHSAR